MFRKRNNFDSSWSLSLGYARRPDFFFFLFLLERVFLPLKNVIAKRRSFVKKKKKKESRFNEISRKKLAIIPVPTYNRKHLLIVIVSEYTVRGERYN